MENLVYEENDEPETFDGFIDSPIYGISKGESMDLMALGNFDMEKEHAVYPYDQSKPYISISNEDRENLISMMGNISHMSQNNIQHEDHMMAMFPCSHFSEEDEYENEDKYNFEHGTSDGDSLISDKDIDEES